MNVRELQRLASGAILCVLKIKIFFRFLVESRSEGVKLAYHLLSPDLFLLKLTGVPFRLFEPRTLLQDIDDNSSANRLLSRQSALRFRVRVSRFRLLPLPESSICF